MWKQSVSLASAPLRPFTLSPANSPHQKVSAFCCESFPGGLSFGFPCPQKFHQSGTVGAPRLSSTAVELILLPEILQFLVEQL